MEEPLEQPAGPGGAARSHGHATLSAVITRADGTVEDLGVIFETDLTQEPEPEEGD